MFTRFDTIHERDRHTDRHTDRRTPHDSIGHISLSSVGLVHFMRRVDEISGSVREWQLF